MSLKVYGIPTCNTCKKACQWLDSQKIAYEFIDTKIQPPTRSMIQEWVAALGAKPMRNTSGQSYRAIGNEKNAWTDEQWVEAFAKDAMLLKRPLFVKERIAIQAGFKSKPDLF
jgi:arsenate reductase